jgi:uncharacterized protein (DUF1499 family)
MRKQTLLISAALMALSLSLTACGGAASKAGGVADGKLAPCPDSPNCVSTQAAPDDSYHRMEPIPFTGSPADAQAKILAAIESMPRNTMITTEPTYIHAEFRSALWRFVDDVEFLIDADTRLIHFRSASRLGYGDMGANRKRMNELVAKIQN